MGCTSSVPEMTKKRPPAHHAYAGYPGRSFEDILATEDTAIGDQIPAVGDSQFTPEFGVATPGFGLEDGLHRSGKTRIFIN